MFSSHVSAFPVKYREATSTFSSSLMWQSLKYLSNFLIHAQVLAPSNLGKSCLGPLGCCFYWLGDSGLQKNLPLPLARPIFASTCMHPLPLWVCVTLHIHFPYRCGVFHPGYWFSWNDGRLHIC
jgi:hypothetical protein